MNPIKQLIESIQKGDAVSVSMLFDKLMAQKLTEAIEDKKIEVVESIFEGEEKFMVFELSEDLDLSQLDEESAAGSLEGLPKHVIKHLTGRQVAGKDSEVTKHQAKSMSSLAGHIKDGLSKGHAVAIHVNGKLHKVVSSEHDSNWGREHFQVHNATGQDSAKKSEWKQFSKRSPAYKHEWEEKKFNKGEAVDRATGGMGEGSHEKEFYKNNHVEVHHIASDKNRMKKHAARTANRPAIQTNYVNKTEAEKSGYLHSDKKRTSETPEGDNLRGVKQAAAEKLAKKKLGATGDSAKAKALEIHKDLQKHIEAGDHSKVRHSLNALKDHMDKVGLEGHDDKVKAYANELPKLKSHYDKEYAKKRLAGMRGETNEDAKANLELFDQLIESYLK